ncbi:MAG: hypothetical protein LBL50_00720 [Candidatus Margulisbacteria bacterium]|jgi:hypothetical protein|nr:hypothetical protein [Candidatus Margulisiibacteriota bacterium]
MDLRKVILGTGILAAAALAGVLDTNDVKLNSTLGLGANPAAIAVNQERKVEGGAIVLNQLSQSNQVKEANIKNPLTGADTISLYNGKNVNSSSFNDSTKFLSYTDTFAGNWFAIRYRYESNLYPNFTANIAYFNAAAQSSYGNKDAKGDMYRKDATETTSLVWGRELIKGLNTGVELASNVYTLDDNRSYNKVAEALPILSLTDSKAYAQSQPYYTLTLGGIYDVASDQKISLAHKFSHERDTHTGDGNKNTVGTDYVETLPAETGLAYIYRVNDALELAGVFKTFWGLTYEKTTKTDGGGESTESVFIAPVNSYGFAASYKVTNEWELQGYGNFLRNYKNSLASGPTGKEEKGYDVTQLGANVQYSPSFLNGGTILLGSYMTRLVNEDPNVGTVFDITNTSLSYSHAF